MHESTFEFLLPTLAALASNLPLYAAWVTAFVIAIARWDRHPRVSLLVVIAIGTLFVTSVAQSVLMMWLPMSLRHGGRSIAQTGMITASIGMLGHLISGACWGMLLVALFGWRGSPAAVAPPSDDRIGRPLSSPPPTV